MELVHYLHQSSCRKNHTVCRLFFHEKVHALIWCMLKQGHNVVLFNRSSSRCCRFHFHHSWQIFHEAVHISSYMYPICPDLVPTPHRTNERDFTQVLNSPRAQSILYIRQAADSRLAFSVYLTTIATDYLRKRADDQHSTGRNMTLPPLIWSNIPLEHGKVGIESRKQHLVRFISPSPIPLTPHLIALMYSRLWD